MKTVAVCHRSIQGRRRTWYYEDKAASWVILLLDPTLSASRAFKCSMYCMKKDLYNSDTKTGTSSIYLLRAARPRVSSSGSSILCSSRPRLRLYSGTRKYWVSSRIFTFKRSTTLPTTYKQNTIKNNKLPQRDQQFCFLLLIFRKYIHPLEK